MARAPLPGAKTHQRWTERVPEETAEGLRLRHPAVEVVAGQRAGSPGEVFTAVAGGAEPMVPGPRSDGGVGGFLVGSVGLTVAAHARRPVVLVRGGRGTGRRRTRSRTPPGYRPPRRPTGPSCSACTSPPRTTRFPRSPSGRPPGAGRPCGPCGPCAPGPHLRTTSVYGLAVDPAFEREVARQETAALSEALRPWRGIPLRGGRRGLRGRKLVRASGRRLARGAPGRRGPRTRPAPLGLRVGPIAHACTAPPHRSPPSRTGDRRAGRPRAAGPAGRRGR